MIEKIPEGLDDPKLYTPEIPTLIEDIKRNFCAVCALRRECKSSQASTCLQKVLSGTLSAVEEYTEGATNGLP